MRKFWALFILCLLALPAIAQTLPQDRIVAKVNNDIITSGDVWSRYRMIQRSSRLPDTESIRKDAFPQVLNSLIEEKLQLQEAKRLNIAITDDDIAKGFNELALRNKVPLEKMLAGLAKDKISIDEIKRQMRSQMSWTAVVQTRIRPRVNVSENEIARLSAELAQRQGKMEYVLAEIQLPAADAAQRKDSNKLANSLALEMRKGAPFDQVAQKISTAPSAPRGGLRQWVLGSELEPEIEKIVTEMPKNAMSKPIDTKDGVWLVLKLEERQAKVDLDPAKLRERIGTRKLEAAANNHLRDLRSEALIEFPQS